MEKCIIKLTSRGPKPIPMPVEVPGCPGEFRSCTLEEARELGARAAEESMRYARLIQRERDPK